MDPEIFFPAWSDRAAIAAAVAICGRCPVRPECAAAGSAEDYGIWGGINSVQQPSERLDPASGSSRRGPMPKPVQHGTLSGWAAEWRRGLPHCEACRLVKNANNIRLRAQKHSKERVA